MDYWSENIGYIVGLITTDGNLSKDKRHIMLTSTDVELLETFRECLYLKNKICTNPPGGYSKKICYRVTFSNVNFYNWLLTIGLKINKTFTLSSLKIPDKYFPDFLRGHIDGDGSIIHYIDKHNVYKNKTYTYNRLYTTFRSGSLFHIKWLRQKMKNLLNINGSLSGWKDKRKDNRKVQWTLRFCKKESLILLKYIYHNPVLPCLLRKKRIAESLLGDDFKNRWSKDHVGADSPLRHQFSVGVEVSERRANSEEKRLTSTKILNFSGSERVADPNTLASEASRVWAPTPTLGTIPLRPKICILW